MNVYHKEQVNSSNMFKLKLEFYPLYPCTYLWSKNITAISYHQNDRFKLLNLKVSTTKIYTSSSSLNTTQIIVFINLSFAINVI